MPEPQAREPDATAADAAVPAPAPRADPATAPAPRSAVPENSEYCGPDQLCRVLLMLRRWEKANDWEGSVSEVSLRRVLDLAFQVSLTTEEGRHPQCRIYVPSRRADAGLRS